VAGPHDASAALPTPRLRDLGLAVGDLAPGPANHLVDVPGVRIGHVDVRREAPPGGRPVCTGVSVVVPPGDPLASPLPAAVDVWNGYGKSAGLVQVAETGALETPVWLTSTWNVPRVADVALSWVLERGAGARTVNPVVCECHDGRLSDATARAVGEAEVRRALAEASPGERRLGAVGAGSALVALGHRAGLGSSSRRVVTAAFGEVTVGVLTQNNFPGRARFAGRTLPAGAPDGGPAGSVIGVLVTDAPLDPWLLRRLARRAFAGIARTGARFAHGSGDLCLAFHAPRDGETPAALAWRPPEGDLDRLFEAATDACEESVWDALLAAGGVPPLGGVPALPREALAGRCP